MADGEFVHGSQNVYRVGSVVSGIGVLDHEWSLLRGSLEATNDLTGWLPSIATMGIGASLGVAVAISSAWAERKQDPYGFLVPCFVFAFGLLVAAVAGLVAYSQRGRRNMSVGFANQVMDAVQARVKGIPNADEPPTRGDDSDAA